MYKKKKAQVEDTPIIADIEVKADDAVLLKVGHTHAGVKYPVGTPVEKLNPSDSTLEFMRVRDII